ncbi:MAG: hypothetical protein P8Y25_12245, partial [Chromatiaceae bacterium]
MLQGFVDGVLIGTALNFQYTKENLIEKCQSLFTRLNGKVNELYPECLNYLDDQTSHSIAELYIKEIKKIAGPPKGYT